MELKEAGISVTLLLPGATAIEFFARKHRLDTKGATEPLGSAADVARTGQEALLRGGDDVVIHGAQNQQAMAQSKQKSEAKMQNSAARYSGLARQLNPVASAAAAV